MSRHDGAKLIRPLRPPRPPSRRLLDASQFIRRLSSRLPGSCSGPDNIRCRRLISSAHIDQTRPTVKRPDSSAAAHLRSLYRIGVGRTTLPTGGSRLYAVRARTHLFSRAKCSLFVAGRKGVVVGRHQRTFDDDPSGMHRVATLINTAECEKGRLGQAITDYYRLEEPTEWAKK